MEQCVFEQNTAGQSGGAICNSTFGTTTLDGCTVADNAAGLEGSAIANVNVEGSNPITFRRAASIWVTIPIAVTIPATRLQLKGPAA
jgi:predicted outer membrane repeat protein